MSKAKIMNQVRQNIQTRLQFLSFVYSTLGSPRDFEITMHHVEVLWNSLTLFNDLKQTNVVGETNSSELIISVKDDLFTWFLNQAKSKDQHAISVETFKQIFVNKMPLLDPNSFSQNALHLYQELFKIYKYSFQQQQLNSPSIENSSLTNFKQMEKSAIDYIGKLAFKSSNPDVSLAAIQFLNSHFTQSDTISNAEQENQFIDSCMNYLNEARVTLENDDQINAENFEIAFEIVQRGILLLKNHLDIFQRRHSFQLRVMQLKSDTTNADHSHANDSLFFFSHMKILQQTTNDYLNRMFKLNAFNISDLNMSFNPFVNDLTRVAPSFGKESNQTNTTTATTNSTTGAANTASYSQHLFITLVCHIIPTQFKFNLTLSLNDCLGDLKAMIREIILKTIKSSQIENDDIPTEETNTTSKKFQLFSRFWSVKTSQ